MLWKFTLSNHCNWHRWLPPLLLAVRVVPQASTGFFPFESLYGWNTPGALDLLQGEWECLILGGGAPPNLWRSLRRNWVRCQQQPWGKLMRSNRSIITARLNPENSLQVIRSSLLLPASENKLLLKWQGLYRMIEEVGPMHYMILLLHMIMDPRFAPVAADK